MPKISELAHIATRSADAVDDTPSHAFVAWGSIIERVGSDAEHQTIDGVPGVLWRGSLTAVLVGLWPDLKDDQDTCRRINTYLRLTENMMCIKRGNSPLWWLAREWRDIDVTLPRGFRPVRSATRAHADAPTVAEPAPVVSTWRCPAENCRYVADTKQALSAHRKTHKTRPLAVVAAPVVTENPVDAITAMVDRSRALEAENQDLRQAVDRLEQRIADINRVLAGR